MILDHILVWYQKKIGTYDKQQWEKTVEQRILSGFNHVPLKNTKLKTEFIDVDLVRGSLFPKAKPKQTLLTVLKLSALRLIFLPIYAKWWVQQTSPKIFIFLLSLYLLQMFNWAVYKYNLHLIDDVDHIVPVSELLIPILISLALSIIHSQIVATANNSSSDKRKKVLHPNRKRRERVRRKKRIIKSRSATISTSSLEIKPSTSSPFAQSQKISLIDSLSTADNSFNYDIFSTKTLKTVHSTVDKIEHESLETTNESTLNKNLFAISNFTHCSSNNNNSNNKNNSDSDRIISKCHENFYSNGLDGICDEAGEKNEINVIDNVSDYEMGDNIDDTTSNTRLNITQSGISEQSSSVDDSQHINKINTSCNNIRKRMVNWNSPIKSVKSASSISSVQSEQLHNSSFESYVNRIKSNNIDDDGFESLNGKSSSGEDNNLFSLHNKNTQQTLTDETVEADDQDSNEVLLNISTDSRQQLPIILQDDISLRCRQLESPPCTSKNNLSPEHYAKFKSKLNTASNVFSKVDSSDTDGDCDDDIDTIAPDSQSTHFTEVTTSAAEWMGITTNSEECYSSEIDSQLEYSENDTTPSIILNASGGSNDRISCTIWDGRETKKAEMSVLDISSAIIERVEGMPEHCDYVYAAVLLSIILSIIPTFCRLCEIAINSSDTTEKEINFLDVPVLLFEKATWSMYPILQFAFGATTWENFILINSFILRVCLTFLFFFLLAVAERTFKQKFLYAKLFSHLTSSRRAKKSELPHFRLNKVRNIKTWLSVRSYLKRRGPQRSVDVIVSAASLITLLLLAFLSVEWLKDSVQVHSQYNLEALAWSLACGCFLLRFMTLGTKINQKYRSISVLITEQINLYLQIEQKPHKKEELMVSNSVLKLASDLLKELDCPFKISGLSANPYLYTTVKVVILSALSGVLSEVLGFKLKLHKIKIK